MKNFYMPLLLLGFLAFAPQVAMGDSLSILSLSEIKKIEKEQAEELKCFYKKKQKFNNEYFGFNLKLEEIKGFKESELVDVDIEYRNDYSKSQRDEWERRRKNRDIVIGSPYTDNRYYLYTGKSPYDNILDTPSVVVNCEEYVFITYKSYKEIWPGRSIGVTPLGVNVIDVQPGSFLKYIPGTEEVKVLPPLSENDFVRHYNSRKWPTYIGFITEEKLAELETKVENIQKEQRPELKYSEYVDEDSEINPKDQLDYDGIPDFVIRGMLIALLLTLVIEGLLAAPFGWKFVGLVSLANIITNPALNGIIWHYQITETSTILLLEAAVVLIEWGIFSVFIRKNYGKLLLFAFVANLVSYLTGVFFPL